MTQDWFNQNVPADIADALIKVEIKLPDNKLIDRDFRPDVLIDYDRLEEQLQDLPGIYAFWSMVLAEQKAIVAKFERAVKRRRGKIVEAIRDACKEEGTSRPPAHEMKEIIEADDKLNELEAALIKSSKLSSKLYAIVGAIRMKSDHLRSLSGFKRYELENS